MNALEWLARQHREIDQLFEAIEFAESSEIEEAFETLAEALAIHAAIEERVFYPAVTTEGTEEVLRDSMEEHFEQKRTLAELMDLEPDGQAFAEMMRELRGDMERHVRREENDLFPLVQEAFAQERLMGLASAMELMADRLFGGGEPSESVSEEADRPAPQ